MRGKRKSEEGVSMREGKEAAEHEIDSSSDGYKERVGAGGG